MKESSELTLRFCWFFFSLQPLYKVHRFFAFYCNSWRLFKLSRQISSCEQNPMLSLVTSLWLHSSWQGQQHEETKGIYLAFEHCKFKNIYTYLHYMIKVFYKILSSKVLRTVLELRKHMYSELSKTATMLQNLRCVTQIFITFLSHIRISGNLVRQ